MIFEYLGVLLAMCLTAIIACALFIVSYFLVFREYDLEKLKLKKNLYAKKLKRQITIRLDEEIIDYFKGVGDGNNISYQSLISRSLWTSKSVIKIVISDFIY